MKSNERPRNVFQKMALRRDRIGELLDLGCGPEQLREAGADYWTVSEAHRQAIRKRLASRRATKGY
jgi:hypothetical protein